MTRLREAEAQARRKSYVPVPLDVFIPGGVPGFALYTRGKGNDIILACPAGKAIPEKDLKAWQADGKQVLYVDTAEHRLYHKYAEAAIDSLMLRDDLPARRKAELCYQTTRELVRDAVATSRADTFVGGSRERWVNNLVTLICQDEASIDGMLSMLSHDYYTYTHMVNVSVMVTALAYRLGERDAAKLRLLAGGGLLHDVGKLRISPDVLNKTGRLTAQEWEEMKTHPDVGLGFLHGRDDINQVELLMVHQHHEKLDGSGYPMGLLGTEIAAEAQMTAVVDIYDALTCKRPYRPAMPHEKAVAILAEEAADKLNADMVRLWAETITEALSTEE